MRLVIILFVCLVKNEVFCGNVRIDPLVLTNQGLIKGQKAEDGDYSAFLGIPYAKVDLANPFGASLPPDDFEEVFNAYNGSVKCPQISYSSNELSYEGNIDCLVLNVYVPSVAAFSNKLPVLVWIHGGGFSAGSGGVFNARDLVRHDIILVTINYRLGPYGFMCLDVPSVPGNQGLKDQQIALQWVKDNIDVFGGNARNVTIAGQSAGGISVDLHIFSAHERLFEKAIIQSGTSQAHGFFVDGDEEAAVKIAARLGFNTEDSSQALDFISTASPNLVTGAALELNLMLMPCKERSFSGVQNFIESDPYSFYSPAKVKDLPILIGHTEKESFNSISKLSNFDSLNRLFYSMIESSFNLDEDDIDEVAHMIHRFYIGDEEISENVLLELESFLSDFILNHPTQRTISKYYEQGASPIFEYLFSYMGRSELRNISGAGASHNEELQYLFALNSELDFTQEDQLVVDRITTMWANFVKFGNPTPEENELLPVKWLPLTETSRPYLEIGSELLLKSRLYNRRMAFWDLFYMAYGRYNKLVSQCDDYDVQSFKKLY